MSRNYWWLVSRDDNNMTVLIFGSAEGEDDARRKGLEMLGGRDFAVKTFPTKDISRASQLLKGNKLERTHDLGRATKRLRHKLKRPYGRTN